MASSVFRGAAKVAENRSSYDQSTVRTRRFSHWAVRVASRPIPGATCLTQSLALHYLLMRAVTHPSFESALRKMAISWNPTPGFSFRIRF